MPSRGWRAARRESVMKPGPGSPEHMTPGRGTGTPGQGFGDACSGIWRVARPSGPGGRVPAHRASWWPVIARVHKAGLTAVHWSRFSSCDATEMSVGSAFAGARSCAPIGRPESSKPAGMFAAGWPMKFHRDVYGHQRPTPLEVRRVPRPAHLPASTGGPVSVGVRSRST